ncbi:MAG: ATP-binding cassette domain-containing protein [Bdellovibrionia bacterium]
MKVLQVENLVKSYKKGFKRTPPILKNISFNIDAGKVTGFLGSNGAGKTTRGTKAATYLFKRYVAKNRNGAGARS